jgi:hypothetical protein
MYDVTDVMEMPGDVRKLACPFRIVHVFEYVGCDVSHEARVTLAVFGIAKRLQSLIGLSQQGDYFRIISHVLDRHVTKASRLTGDIALRSHC